MLRLESKIASARFVEMADEMGIPLMYGWMCCNQWERWQQWDDEDRRVARDSLASQIAMLRPHASVFLWANGSDGRPPDDVRREYRRILEDLHWPNAIVDTVSSFARDSDGTHCGTGSRWPAPTPGARRPTGSPAVTARLVDPAPSRATTSTSRRSPACGRSSPGQAVADQRHLVLPRRRESGQLRADQHPAGDRPAIRPLNQRRDVCGQGSTRPLRVDPGPVRVLRRQRLGQPQDDGLLDAQQSLAVVLRQYLRLLPAAGRGLLRRQEGFAPAVGGVRLLAATGEHRRAHVRVVNQGPDDRKGLRVRVRVYDVSGRVRDDRRAENIDVESGGVTAALTLGAGPPDSPVFFVRAELLNNDGTRLTENVYWQSRQIDDLGSPENDTAFATTQVSWADMTALNTIARPRMDISARAGGTDGEVTVRLSNPTPNLAFFCRAELLTSPIPTRSCRSRYDDNYVTVFPMRPRRSTAGAARRAQTGLGAGHRIRRRARPCSGGLTRIAQARPARSR